MIRSVLKGRLIKLKSLRSLVVRLLPIFLPCNSLFALYPLLDMLVRLVWFILICFWQVFARAPAETFTYFRSMRSVYDFSSYVLSLFNVPTYRVDSFCSFFCCPFFGCYAPLVSLIAKPLIAFLVFAISLIVLTQLPSFFGSCSFPFFSCSYPPLSKNAVSVVSIPVADYAWTPFVSIPTCVC